MSLPTAWGVGGKPGFAVHSAAHWRGAPLQVAPVASHASSWVPVLYATPFETVMNPALPAGPWNESWRSSTESRPIADSI